ncbi:MAG: hypothetical protein KF721_03885 [Ignavibacteriaceae bacterium]|nr:hypothetical protein [Ignavibacteriaceae bacterium]HRI47053.1 hypothetical protein [Ignavibacteriaceae bacterium]
MNTGQSMLTLGAIMLLSFLTLRINSNLLIAQTSLHNAKFGLLATSLAASMMERGSRLAFDEASVDDAITTLTQLTPPNSLGPESGETLNTFDDLDDFNNYDVTDSSMPSAIFRVRCKVFYINPSAPSTPVNSKTYHKNFTVSVTSASMEDSISFSSVLSYWTFR